MADTQQMSDGTPRGDGATIAALADEMDTEHALVRSLYEEELAVLDSHSRVKNFIPLIAARRVRERLRSHGRTHAAPGRAGRRPHVA